MGGFDAQCVFKGCHKGLEHIQNQAVCFADDGIEFRIHQSGENNRWNPIFRGGLVDVADGIAGLINAIHKRDANVLKSGLKLGQNRLAEVLGGNACAIRNNKNNTGLGSHENGLKVEVSTTIES